jgi:hypothetical protein
MTSLNSHTPPLGLYAQLPQQSGPPFGMSMLVQDAGVIATCGGTWSPMKRRLRGTYLSLGLRSRRGSLLFQVIRRVATTFAVVTAADGWAENHRPAGPIGVPLRLRASEEEGTSRLVGVHLILAVSVNLLRARSGGGQNYESKSGNQNLGHGSLPYVPTPALKKSFLPPRPLLARPCSRRTPWRHGGDTAATYTSIRR